MKTLTTALVVAASLYAGLAGAQQVAPAPNGITLPEGYKNWRLIGLSQRNDNNTLRAILGNDVAIKAAREGKTTPWPDGTVFAKLAWKNSKHDKWETAVVPGDFIQAEFMIKDGKKYGETGGWGFARWVGKEQKPYGKDAGFVQECFGCHTPVKDRDYVFTHPVRLP